MAAAPAEARNLIFGGKNPARGVQVPARPDRRTTAFNTALERHGKQLLRAGKIIENKKTKRIIEKKVRPLTWGCEVSGPEGRDGPGGRACPAALGWQNCA